MCRVKPAIFHPAALASIRLYPARVRKEIGKAIFDLQSGESLTMPLSRPMPSVGRGVCELRVRDRSGIFRVFYYAQSARGILVFHAFVKKTQATPQRELGLARRRWKELIDEKE
jgi:phage-related protein